MQLSTVLEVIAIVLNALMAARLSNTTKNCHWRIKFCIELFVVPNHAMLSQRNTPQKRLMALFKGQTCATIDLDQPQMMELPIRLAVLSF